MEYFSEERIPVLLKVKLPDWLTSALPNETTANQNSRSTAPIDPILGHIGPDDRRW